MEIITLGVFDVLHAGHVRLLKFCKQLGNVVVGLNTDEFVYSYKKKYSVMNYQERKTILEELGYKVLPNDQRSGSIKPLLKGIDLIVVGSDWALKDYIKQIGLDWKWLEKHNIGICYYPRSLDMSSSKIKERIKCQK
jgi:glycerol-3-phosphate cytidylyltransferase